MSRRGFLKSVIALAVGGAFPLQAVARQAPFSNLWGGLQWTEEELGLLRAAGPSWPYAVNKIWYEGDRLFLEEVRDFWKAP